MSSPRPPLAGILDVQVRMGETLDAPEDAQVESFLAYASARLRAHRPDIDDRIATMDLDSVLVTGVIVTAVVRALDTMRTGLRVRGEQFPEISTTYADADASLVYFTPEDLAILDPQAGASGGAFTIRVG